MAAPGARTHAGEVGLAEFVPGKVSINELCKAEDAGP